MNAISPDAASEARTDFNILAALAKEDRHGYAIMQDVAERTGRQLRLSPGTLYGSIKRMLEEGSACMAMGAARGQVVRLVLRGAMTSAGGGIALGLAAGALGLSRVLANLLFEVPACDPITFAAAGTTLALVALAACYVPASRATRINPTLALRSE